MPEKLPNPAPQTGIGGFDLHQAIGGTAGWRRLSVAFYSRVQTDPRIRPLFPGKTLHCAIEEFTAFLVQLFGGPSDDTQRRWWLSLRESHLRFEIRQKERAAWMENMVKALDDVQIDERLRSALREFFERSSAHVVTNEEPSPGASDSSQPPSDAIRREIAWRWDAQRALDDAVAAVRNGDSERAIAAAESFILRTRFERHPSLLAGLLARMIGSRNPAMLRFVQEKLAANPAIVRERYAGRTLLHEASARGNLTMVKLLLQLGADPNAKDGGDHTPLYAVANECGAPEGGSVVRALTEGGANVNANDGVKRCTALHMAARRGSLAIAEALLDCGADIEAHDSLGDTPLRRSVNCNKPRVAALLLTRGADIYSIGTKRMTPLLAARTTEMKQLLRSCGNGSGTAGGAMIARTAKSDNRKRRVSKH